MKLHNSRKGLSSLKQYSHGCFPIDTGEFCYQGHNTGESVTNIFSAVDCNNMVAVLSNRNVHQEFLICCSHSCFPSNCTFLYKQCKFVTSHAKIGHMGTENLIAFQSVFSDNFYFIIVWLRNVYSLFTIYQAL